MPYEKISELPPPVKDNLPAHAQEIFLASYNSAFDDWDKDKTEAPREVYANSVAWAAVKRSYVKNDAGEWVEKKGCSEEEDEKAGKRLQTQKTNILTEMKSGLEGLLQKLAELLGWAQYEDGEEEEDAMPAWDTMNGWRMAKAADGTARLIVWSTNSFEDREEETFRNKALADYLAWADKSNDRGTIDFWHIPGSDFATVKEQAMIGRFLVEVAEFDPSPIGQAFKAFLEQHPRGHREIAPHGWGASPQYRYDPADRADRIYERMRKEKTSVLPAHKAANAWNPQPEVYGMDDEKKKALEAILGTEKTAELIAQGEELTKELERQGVAFKAEASAPEPAPQEPPPETPPAEAPPAQEEKAAPDIAALLAPAFAEIAAGLKALGDRLAILETKAAEPPPVVEEKAAPEPTPFDSFAALIRASVIGTPEARLDGRTKEGRNLTAGPEQNINGNDGPTPVPFINAMLAGQDVKSALGVPLGND